MDVSSAKAITPPCPTAQPIGVQVFIGEGRVERGRREQTRQRAADHHAHQSTAPQPAAKLFDNAANADAERNLNKARRAEQRVQRDELGAGAFALAKFAIGIRAMLDDPGHGTQCFDVLHERGPAIEAMLKRIRRPALVRTADGLQWH